jgi:hypothetical protein
MATVLVLMGVVGGAKAAFGLLQSASEWSDRFAEMKWRDQEGPDRACAPAKPVIQKEGTHACQ